MNRRNFVLALGAAGAFVAADLAVAQQKTPTKTFPVATSSASKAGAALEQAAADGKFAFIVFSKDDGPAVKAMAQTASTGVAKRSDRATLTFAKVTDPAEAALVTRFDIGRAPMPLTLAVAPNGAITGMFPRELKDENIDASIVTPTMTKCMKSLQENKLVFVCVQTSSVPVIPAAVKEMQADPHFKDRITTATMQVRDPAENMFISQMQLDPTKVKGPMIVVLAPPGLLIGKYEAATATKTQLALAISDAGKCCDDPNCVHNQAAKAQAQPTAKQPAVKTTVPVKKGN